jgi:hypothetical protein
MTIPSLRIMFRILSPRIMFHNHVYRTKSMRNSNKKDQKNKLGYLMCSLIVKNFNQFRQLDLTEEIIIIKIKVG